MVQGSQSAARRLRGPFLIDAHVHCHACFEPARFLEAAWANLRRIGLARPEPVGDGLGCLLLADIGEERSLPRLQADVGVRRRGWTLEQTGDGVSLLACRDGMPRLLLVAGRQIATTDGLEVLALGSTAEFRRQQSVEATLDAVRGEGAIPVVPWGVGKWWGRRGELVLRLLDRAAPGWLWLGDNGNRPRGWPTPGPFARAAARGIGILPGSDPLALAHEIERVGSYGCIVDGEIECSRPGERLLALLRAADAQPRIFGRLQELPRFGLNQLVMHWRRRRAA